MRSGRTLRFVIWNHVISSCAFRKPTAIECRYAIFNGNFSRCSPIRHHQIKSTQISFHHLFSPSLFRLPTFYHVRRVNRLDPIVCNRNIFPSAGCYSFRLVDIFAQRTEKVAEKLLAVNWNGQAMGAWQRRQIEREKNNVFVFRLLMWMIWNLNCCQFSRTMYASCERSRIPLFCFLIDHC